jgi:hypothetical protein
VQFDLAYRVVALSMLRGEAVGSHGVAIHHQAVVAVAAALAVLDIRTPEPDVVQDRVGGIHLHHYARRHPVGVHTERETYTHRERDTHIHTYARIPVRANPTSHTETGRPNNKTTKNRQAAAGVAND